MRLDDLSVHMHTFNELYLYQLKNIQYLCLKAFNHHENNKKMIRIQELVMGTFRCWLYGFLKADKAIWHDKSLPQDTSTYWIVLHLYAKIEPQYRENMTKCKTEYKAITVSMTEEKKITKIVSKLTKNKA